MVFKDNSGDVTKEVLYEYDIFNRRITKIIDADGEGRAAHFSRLGLLRRIRDVYGVSSLTEVLLWNPLPRGVCWHF